MHVGQQGGMSVGPLDYRVHGSPFGSVQSNGSLAWLQDGVLVGQSNDGVKTVGLNPYGAGQYYGFAAGYDWGGGRQASLDSVAAYPTSNVGFCGFQGSVSGLFVRVYGADVAPASAGWTTGRLLATGAAFSEQWTGDPGPASVTVLDKTPCRYNWIILGSPDTAYLGHPDMYMVELTMTGTLISL